MGRRRFIAPEYFKHADLYDAEVASGLPLRIAFAGLWCQCDRRGLFVWSPRSLKTDILPYDEGVNFEAVLSALASAGFVEYYEVGGKGFGRVPSFLKWQSFHKNEAPSSIIPDFATVAVSKAPEQRQPSNDRPTPSIGGLTPSPSTAVTVAVTVAGTVAASSTATADSGLADDGRLLTDDALLLTTAANAGISQRYGEQPVPIHHGHPGGMQVAEALRAAGISVEYAHAVIFAAAAALTNDRPPRSVKYFLGLVLDRWHAEQARTAAASYTPTTQPAAPEVDQMRTFAARYARDGSAEWQAYCDERQIPWEVAA